MRARASAANTEDGAVKEAEPEASSSGEEEEEEEEASGAADAADAAADADPDASASASAPSVPRGKKMSRKQKKKSKKTAAAQAKAKAVAERTAAEDQSAKSGEASDSVSASASASDSDSPDPVSPEARPASRAASQSAVPGSGARRTKNPKKGVDLLLPVDYLSPALAQKMARNGHLSALSQGVSASDAPASFPTPEMESLTNASSNAASAAGKKNLESVLYASDALAEPKPSSTGRPQTPSFTVAHDFEYAKSPTPVFVMLPLDVISRDGALQHKTALLTSLRTLRKIGVEGVMIDVWWGIVERDGPEQYDWTAYLELLDMVAGAGLKLNAVMSFHACGANVGDYFKVTLPKWVLDAAVSDPDLFFTDQYGYRNPECISLWADNAMTLHGRTPLECYRDFMASFRDAVESEGLGETLSEVSVGCGPCGELRYPAYPENKIVPNSSQWQFPGIGEFQCYDQRALGNLARAGSEAGHIEWGGAGPHDAGGYNNLPHETGFFRAHEGSWDSEYGQFFLSWYAGELVEHGDRMLRCARSVFEREDDNDVFSDPDGGTSGRDARGESRTSKKSSEKTSRQKRKRRVPALAIKCAGVHWWYNSRSHAAELTAGYFNTRSGDRCPERDGYEPIVAICGKHGARLNFTCAEMRDVEHPFFSRCGPEGLLRQIRAAAARYGVKVAGENALCRFDQDAYDKIITNCRGEGDDAELWSTGALLPPMASFTFLRLSKELFEDDNFRSFVRFVARMANETGTEVVEAGNVVQAEEVLSSLFSAEADLLPGGLRDIREETSSGFVAAQFSDL